MAKTVTLRNVEMLRPGTWNGVQISLRDLEDVAQAYKEAGQLLPASIRLGHDARQAFAKALVAAGQLPAGLAGPAAADEQGWPALGEVSDLAVRNGVLVGTVANVPEVLAGWIRDNRYNRRSVGLVFNKTVGGKIYRWWLDHLALLGSVTPAVDGLSTIGLSEGEGTASWTPPAEGPAGEGQMVEVSFSVSDADGWLDLGETQDAATALDKLVEGLTGQFDQHVPLVYGRKGAPMVRQLFQAFLAKLRETARADLPTTMGDGNMKLSVEALRGLFGLGEGAQPVELAAALNGADKEAAGKLLELAGSMAFETADQLVGWLAGALGLAPSDLAGIAAKVVELMGGSAPEPGSGDPAAGDPAAQPAEAPMSATTPTVNVPAAPKTAVVPPPAKELVELTAIATQALGEVQALKEQLQLRDAQAKVAADAAARNMALPVPVANTLVSLQLAGDTAGYEAILSNVRGVPATERGSSGNAEGNLQLADNEVRSMMSLGYSEEDARRILVADKQAAG